MTYPAERFMRTTVVDSKIVPAFAPEVVADALEAYEPFLYVDAAVGREEIAGDIESRKADMADDPDFDDDYYDNDEIVACTVHENGDIHWEGGVMTRESIFRTYGVEDISAPTP